MRAELAALLLVALAATRAASAQDEPQGVEAHPPSAVEKADDLAWKATASAYFLPRGPDWDVNLRHKLGDLTAWVGAFVDPHDNPIGRLGAEYDYQRKGLLVIPTLQVGTNGLLAGQIYGEVGTTLYAILGYSRTNLKPLFSLSFDPNESVQLGAGWHLSAFDRVFAFSIFDVRLGTGQQDTHVLWRKALSARDGLTADVLYKSGRRDDGRYVLAVGLGFYYDRPGWFVKAYYDPYVNFTADTMWRLGGGLKF